MGARGHQQTYLRFSLDAEDGSRPPGVLTFIWQSRLRRPQPQSVLLQCLALQAQVTALTDQNEQHTKDLEATPHMSGVAVAAADPSEKVSGHFEEATQVISRDRMCLSGLQEECGRFVVLVAFFLTLVIHHLSDFSKNELFRAYHFGDKPQRALSQGFDR